MTKQRRRNTAFLRNGARTFFAPLQAFEEGRPAALWRSLFFRTVKPDLIDTLGELRSDEARNPGGHLIVCRALGLALDREADEAPRHVLNYLGVTAASIVAEGAQWRLADGREPARDAVIVPVGGSGVPAMMARCLALLGRHDFEREADAAAIGDLVAIPVDGGELLTFNGTTAAIGTFEPVPDVDLDAPPPAPREAHWDVELTAERHGAAQPEAAPIEETIAPRKGATVRLGTNGLAWFRRHVSRARRMAKHWPAHLVARKLLLPHCFETLLLDARAFSWRMTAGNWMDLVGVTKLMCDSEAVAKFIQDELQTREPLPKAPAVQLAKGR